MAGRQVRHHPPDRAQEFLNEHPDVVKQLIEGQVEAERLRQRPTPPRPQKAVNAAIAEAHRQADRRRSLAASFKNHRPSPTTRSPRRWSSSAEHAEAVGLLEPGRPQRHLRPRACSTRSCGAGPARGRRRADRRTADASSESRRHRSSRRPPERLRPRSGSDGVSKVVRARRQPALLALDRRLARRSQPGEFVCLLGASGCGKSTLLNLVAGLDQPTGGHGSTSRGAHVALMFQEAALFPWLTVAGNVELAAAAARACRKRERRGAGRGAARRSVHLGGFGDKRPHELSGGMRQRVALARALAQDADVLLMDEPFGALDAMTRDLLHDELERLWRERDLTVLFVTHNVREAVRLGDRVVLLRSRPGRVVEEFAGRRSTRPRRIDSPEVAGSPRRSPTGCARRCAAMAALTQAPRASPTAIAQHELAGLDALELARRPERRRAAVPASGRRRGRSWPRSPSSLLVWQVVVVVAAGSRSTSCPARSTVLPAALADDLGDADVLAGHRRPPCAARSSASRSRCVIGAGRRRRSCRGSGCCARPSAR